MVWGSTTPKTLRTVSCQSRGRRWLSVALVAGFAMASCAGSGGDGGASGGTASGDDPAASDQVSSTLSDGAGSTDRTGDGDGEVEWSVERVEALGGDRYVGSLVRYVAAEEQAAWVFPQTPARLYHLDIAAERFEPVDLGPPGAPIDVEITANGSWFLGGAEWLRLVDPISTDIVVSVDIGIAYSFTSTDADLWVITGGGGTLTRVDVLTGEVTQEVSYADGMRQFFDPPIAATADAVWLADVDTEFEELGSNRAAIVRVDVATGEAERVLEASGKLPATAVVASHDAIWALFDGELVRLDPDTGERVASIPANTPTLEADPEGVVGLAASPDGLWFGDADGNASFFDPATNEVAKTIELPMSGYVRLMEATTQALWIIGLEGPFTSAGTLFRIDL